MNRALWNELRLYIECKVSEGMIDAHVLSANRETRNALFERIAHYEQKIERLLNAVEPTE